MKKMVWLLLCSIFVSLIYVTPVSAETTVYSRTKAGIVQLKDGDVNGNVYLATTQSNISPYRQAYFLFRIPVSAVSAGDCLVIDSTDLGGFDANFFWSSLDLTKSMYWNSKYTNGFAAFGESMPSYYFQLLTGELSKNYEDNRIHYDAGVNVFDLPAGFRNTSGYLYISGFTTDSWDSSSLQVAVMPLSEVPGSTPEPTPTPSPTPTPTPTPTPSPDPLPTPSPVIPDIGSASSELGTFGTDDGTQNGVFAAFKKLYDSLFDIVTDDTTPDMSILDDAAVGSAAVMVYADAVSYSLDAVAYSLGDFDPYGSDSKVLLDKWRAEQYETIEIGQSWDISPSSVEIAQTGTVQGAIREGNFYVLHYQLHLPFRFIYSGHVGTAYSNPVVYFNLRMDYAGAPQYGGVVQYGTPYVYVSNDGVSYDLYDTLEVDHSVISGDVGIALLNIPVLDDISRDSYDVVIDFPLYISNMDPLVFANAFAYETTVTLESLTYTQDLLFVHLSDAAADQTLQDIYDEQKKQNELENERYQEEQEKTQEAIDSVGSGVTEITGTLSSWEIFTLPLTIMKDFVQAITSSSEAKLTFPSFSLMGQTLWPSYTFDLDTVSENFPLLCNSLHLISGILVVIWFLRYLWRKWALITGDDLPEEG